MSFANGKIQDVIRTRCAGSSYCHALPPERSDYVYLTMTNAKWGIPPTPLRSCENFNPSQPRLSSTGDASRTYIMRCTISFLAPIHPSVPFRRVRILKRIEATRFHNSVSPQFDILQIIGAVYWHARLDLTACKTS